MENNENFAAEQAAENVEQTTEQTPKTYTQEEVDAIVGKRIARSEAKIRKEYDRDYGSLMETLEAGTGKKGVKEVNDAFQKFYASKGVKMPQKPSYSAKEIEVLAKADAAEFIDAGFEDVVEETERLAKIGVANMTARDKAVFKILAEHRQSAERSRELSELGVTEDVYNSKEFQDFAKKFNSDTSMKDIYDIYKLKYPKEKPKTMGSMKNPSPSEGVKDYYSPEEISKLSAADLRDDNVWAKVRRSMTGG